MTEISEIVSRCKSSLGYFFKYISANDTGKTGSHQAGLYMPKETWSLFFPKPGLKNENKDIYINIKWDFGEVSESRFIWYGRGSRSEYRLTRGMTFLNNENIGDIIILAKIDEHEFSGYLLNGDEKIDEFLNAIDLSPLDSCKIQIPGKPINIDRLDCSIINNWVMEMSVDFPPSNELSDAARRFSRLIRPRHNYKKDYDSDLVEWVETEYELFRIIENDRYKKYLERPFPSIPELIVTANSILNRRKSRAGLSFENHLVHIFNSEKIPFSTQEKTEGNKKPDFIFPGIEAYRDNKYSSENLIILSAKTTCKDRWRQILNEASRLKSRYLITLQHGISENQYKEMENEQVTLIVPYSLHKYYPTSYKEKILRVSNFVKLLKEKYIV